MKIALLRVDERLIHGQVTMGWARSTGANLLLAINDKVAKDAFQKNVMKMAAPPGVDIEIVSVDEAAENLKNSTYANRSVLLLVRNPMDVVRLIEQGVELKKINIGGVRQPGANIKLTKEVQATPEELEAWKKLDQMDVKMEVQWLPGQGITNLNEIVRKK